VAALLGPNATINLLLQQALVPIWMNYLLQQMIQATGRSITMAEAIAFALQKPDE
jgi:hypothetical protein